MRKLVSAICRWLEEYYQSACRREEAVLAKSLKKAIRNLEYWENTIKARMSLSRWQEEKIKDMYRYVKKYKYLPDSYKGLLSGWLEEKLIRERALEDGHDA